MSREKVAFDDAIASALSDFRGSGEDQTERFLVLGYRDQRTLEVVAMGDGVATLSALVEAGHFVPDKCRYVLLRKPHRVELADTVKFAYIDWTPDTLKPMRKALLSTHKGQVEDYLKPFHVSLSASDEGDLDDAVIDAKIGFSSGTASFVVGHEAVEASIPAAQKAKAAARAAGGRPDRPAGAGKKLVPDSVRDNREVPMEDEEAVRAAMAAVRSDEDPTDWLCLTYTPGEALTLVGTGEGGVEALQAQLDDTNVCYGLVRTTAKIDDSTTTKFTYVRLLSDQVSPMKRARFATHSGFITSLLEPFHIELKVDAADEFTRELVDERVHGVMGTRSNVRTAEEASHLRTYRRAETRDTKPSASARRKSAVPSVPTGGTKDAVNVDQDFKDAVLGVHSDDDPTTWMVATYSGKYTLSLVATGTGDSEELKAAVPPDSISFGLYRVVEIIDKSTTVKFVFFKFQSDNVKPMMRAQAGTKIGAIQDLFRPFHVDLFAATPDEISEELIVDAVATASGKKSHIKAKKAT